MKKTSPLTTTQTLHKQVSEIRDLYESKMIATGPKFIESLFEFLNDPTSYEAGTDHEDIQLSINLIETAIQASSEARIEQKFFHMDIFEKAFKMHFATLSREGKQKIDYILSLWNACYVHVNEDNDFFRAFKILEAELPLRLPAYYLDRGATAITSEAWSKFMN